MIGNIPEIYRSNINNIQLILLCKESFIKTFSFEKILEPLIFDLLELENSGVDITSNGSLQNFRGSLFAMLGDNLGCHQIGGFTENFSCSKNMCRYCFYDREALKAFDINLADERNATNYNECLKNISSDPSLGLGVTKDSCLNRLNYYHVCSGLPPCISHDLFEGIIPYDLMEICKYFCNLNIISTSYLNMAFSSLRKKFKLQLSFPPVELNMKKFPGKADEIRNFVFLFPLLFLNRFSNYDDSVWKFLITMVEMCRLICSSEIHENQILLLSHYINVYMEYRRECFPVLKLRPKHHYICHYPGAFEAFVDYAF